MRCAAAALLRTCMPAAAARDDPRPAVTPCVQRLPTSGGTAPAPAPPQEGLLRAMMMRGAVGAAACVAACTAPAVVGRPCTDAEAAAVSWCEYNGNCTCNGHACACDCDAAWRGTTCGELALLPAPPPVPLRSGGTAPLPAYPPHTLLNLTPPTNSWGGGVVHDPSTGKWNMFVSEFANQCGLGSWGTNSAIVRAVSDSPAGPYQRVQVLLPPFAHNPSVARDPTDGTYVVWHIGCGRPKGGNQRFRPCDCRPSSKHGCNRTSEEPACTRNTTDILYAPSTEGPWRRLEAAEGPTSFFQIDNPAPYHLCAI